MPDFSHLTDEGDASMVDVSGKAVTAREARVRGFLRLKPAHLEGLGRLPKGDALTVAQIAGIQGGKKCSELIPLCHPIALTKLDVFLEPLKDGIGIEAVAKTESQTGVEMEAYAAVVVAGITLIDMFKGIDPDLTLTDIQLITKTGGKAPWHRESVS